MLIQFNPFNQYDRNYVVKVLELTAGMVASNEAPPHHMAGNAPAPVASSNPPARSGEQIDQSTGEITNTTVDGSIDVAALMAATVAPSAAGALPSPNAPAGVPAGLPTPPSDAPTTAPTTASSTAPAPAPTTPPPAGPRVYASDVEVDANNLPWDNRIHSTPATKNKGDKCWRQKRETPAELLTAVTAELRDAGWRAPETTTAPPQTNVPPAGTVPPASTLPPASGLPPPPADAQPAAGLPPPPPADAQPAAGLPQPSAAPAEQTAAPASVVAAPVAPPADATGAPGDFKTFMARFSAGLSASNGAVPADTLVQVCQGMGLINTVQLALPANKPRIAEAWAMLNGMFPEYFA